MVPVDPYQVVYTFTAGDPRVERRRNISEYDRKHHVKKLERLRMKYPLEKFKGSTPPKPMPKEQREKISRGIIRRHQRNGAKHIPNGSN